MKRIIITLLAFALSSITLAYAQGIHVGDTFYDGDLVYTVKEIRMGTVVYMTDVLGEEELTLLEQLNVALIQAAERGK